MAIKKFKTFEEAEQDLWCIKPDDAYFERLNKLYKFAFANSKKYSFKRGIRKYRSIEEANKDEF